MVTTGEKVVESARGFRGVKWEHQGRTAQGMDCCGFVVEVAIAGQAAADIEFERDYRRAENGERMLELLARYLDNVAIDEATADVPRNPFAHAEVGDVLALCDEQLKERSRPVHLAFLSQLSPYPAMIHCSQHGVVEHRIDIHFRERICSVWHYRVDSAQNGVVSDFQTNPGSEAPAEGKKLS